jgi:uncharacterized protein (TIGR03083 family)
MTDEDLRAAVVAERREQADMLAALRPEQWDAPTLCEGWRVREVVAHTTMPFRTSLARTLVELVRAGGDFNRMADRRARHDAATLPPETLVEYLRANVAHPWTPPGGGVHGALAHDVIHGLDITVGLGLNRRVPPQRVALGPGRDAAAQHQVLRRRPGGRRPAGDRPRLDLRHGNADPGTRAGPAARPLRPAPATEPPGRRAGDEVLPIGNRRPRDAGPPRPHPHVRSRPLVRATAEATRGGHTERGPTCPHGLFTARVIR